MPFASKEKEREYHARWKKANRAKLRAADTAYQRRRYATDAEYREQKKESARRYCQSPAGRAADRRKKENRREYYLAYWRAYSKRRVRTLERRLYERAYERRPEIKRLRAEYAKRTGYASQKRYNKTPAGKAIARENEARPEVIRRRMERMGLGGYAAQKRHAKTAAGKAMFRRVEQRRRALKRGVSATLTTTEWKEIKRAYDDGCAYCGRMDVPLTQDHVLPLGEGPHVALNVVPACRSCNSKKRRRSLHVVLADLGEASRTFWRRQSRAWKRIQERLGV